MADNISADKVRAGIALYSRLFLSLYDSFALGFSCRFVWKCPSSNMLEMYNKHVSANHLDIGVGTGYFLDHCQFPTKSPRLALMDLNPNSLHVASKRLARYNPEVYKRNALEPFNVDAPAFDSVGIMNLLHCLPGNLSVKGIVFENIKSVLNPGGIVFGSIIMYNGVKRNSLATAILKVNNLKGIMSNMEDDFKSLQQSFQRHFSASSVQTIGCEALFWAQE